MAQAISMDEDEKHAVILQPSVVQEPEPVIIQFPRPAAFSATEMQLLSPFYAHATDTDVDAKTILMYLLSRVVEHCMEYTMSVRKGILPNSNTKILPKPLTFFLLQSLVDHFQQQNCLTSGKENEYADVWKVLQYVAIA